MTDRTPEKKAADQIAAIILEEYGETDDRVGQRLLALSQGDENVARECLLLMAATHVQGALALWEASGWGRLRIAEEISSTLNKR